MVFQYLYFITKKSHQEHWIHFLWSISGCSILLRIYYFTNIVQPWLLYLYGKSWNWILWLLQLCSSSLVLYLLVVVAPFSSHVNFRVCPHLQNRLLVMIPMCFTSGSVVKNLPATQEMQEMRVWSLGWEGPWRRAWQPTPVFRVRHDWATNTYV